MNEVIERIFCDLNTSRNTVLSRDFEYIDRLAIDEYFYGSLPRKYEIHVTGTIEQGKSCIFLCSNRFCVFLPLAGQKPFIGKRIQSRSGHVGSSGFPKICFWRLISMGNIFWYRGQCVIGNFFSIFSEKVLNNLFCLFIPSFSKMKMSKLSLLVYKIFGWPVSIIVSSPECEIIIEYNWVFNPGFFHCFFYICFLAFKCKFWCMCPDNNKSLISIFFIERYQIWQGSLTINTRVCPKIDNYYLSFQRLLCQWFTINPNW